MGIIEKIVVDDVTMRELEAAARLNGRTVSEEVAQRLEASLPRPTTEEIVAGFEAIAAMTPKGVKQTDSTLLLREDRDR